MSIKGFFEELNRGLKSAAYILYSEEAYLLKEALRAVKETIPDSERDFMFYAFDMESPEYAIPVEQIVDILYTVPFLGGTKVVAIEGCQKLSDKEFKRLAHYTANPSPDSVLMLLNTGTLKKSLRDMFKGVKFIPLDIKERELPFWVKETASREGLELTAQAVQYLIGTMGPDVGLLSSEVKKLAFSGKQKLDVADIMECIKGNGGYDVFDLIRALKAKDAVRVFKIYRALSEMQEPHSLLGALNWHYERSLTRVKDRNKVFTLLNEADLMVKSSGGAFPLEYLLVRLLQI